MTDATIKDLLRKLVELQKFDKQIYDLKILLKEKPQEIEVLKQEFESSKATLNKLEAALKEVQLRRKEVELQLQEKEGGIVKANEQLSQIKTNREYTAKLHEIESIKADKSQLEEKILILFDEADAVQKDIDQEKQVVSQQEQAYLGKKKLVEDEVKQIESEISQLESQRKGVDVDLDLNYLSLYQKTLAAKSGLAIVPVQGNACGGCYMNVTSQMLNAIRMHQDIIQCEHCTRLLYLEDDL